MSLLELALFLTVQPLVSPSYPWPLPEALASPEAAAISVPGPPQGPAVPFFPESLEFSVKWGIVKAGVATLSVTELVRFDDAGPFGGGPPRTAYRVVSTARSKGVAEAVYPVRDRNQSWIDTATLGSLAFFKQLREGTFFRDEWVRYFPDEGRYVLERRNKQGEVARRQGAIPDRIHDVLSALYYVRTQPLEVGRDIVLDVNSGANWPLVVKVLKREKVEVPAGRFDCFVVEPRMRAEGIFIQKGKRLTVWLTADERRMPVLMEVEVFIGNISARLESYKRG